MPVWISKHITSDTLLGIWKIDESIDELLKPLALQSTDLKLYNTFKVDQRKKQWLAYRLLIKKMMNNEDIRIQYSDSGKPMLDVAGYHVSVAHTADYAAAIISRSGRVGIDIEEIKPRITKVKEKFLSQKELSFISEEYFLEKLTAFWGAKESMLKLCGIRHLDFRNEMKVSDFEYAEQGEFTGQIITQEIHETFTLHYQQLSHLMLVYVIENKSA